MLTNCGNSTRSICVVLSMDGTAVCIPTEFFQQQTLYNNSDTRMRCQHYPSRGDDDPPLVQKRGYGGWVPCFTAVIYLSKTGMDLVHKTKMLTCLKKVYIYTTVVRFYSNVVPTRRSSIFPRRECYWRVPHHLLHVGVPTLVTPYAG